MGSFQLFYCFAILVISFKVTEPSFQSQLHSIGNPRKDNSTNTMEEPNPPVWPESVLLFRDTDNTESMLNKIKKTEDTWNEEHQTYTCEHHFSNRRYALLFAPGVYRNLDFEIGYYVQLAGLGTSVEDVQFQDCEKGPHVPALNRHLHENGTCLDTFWRSGENFASHAKNGMMWAVSQASPLRNVHIGTDLHLHDGGAYASGGHLANAHVDGHTYFGGQQQFLSRNVHFTKGATGGAWGMIYVGCSGQVPEPFVGNGTSASITVVEAPKVQIEKPYIALQDDGIHFDLRVPKAFFSSSNGNHDDKKATKGGPLLSQKIEDVRDFSRVRVVKSTEPSNYIQEALDEGKDVVLAPGVFHLENTIQIKKKDQVLLGLGLATLISPKHGSPCIQVSGRTPGVRIAGVMLEASERYEIDPTKSKNPTLLEWGEKDVEDPGESANPGALFDVFCRVGGTIIGNRTNINVQTMLKIYSGNVVGDNLWLWRADHAELKEGEVANYPQISSIFYQSEENDFRVETGVEILGDDITIYGLAVEHANGHQTVWRGERGTVYFYQCEFPYDVSSEFGKSGYKGYLVTDNVHEHKVCSAGIYSNFRNDIVHVDTAILYPERQGVNFINPFIVHLDNNGHIGSVANGKGKPAEKQGMPIRLESVN